MILIDNMSKCRPFYAICFLLPMLCQLTMEIEGCKALISCGGHNAVSRCNLIFVLSDQKILVVTFVFQFHYSGFYIVAS